MRDFSFAGAIIALALAACATPERTSSPPVSPTLTSSGIVASARLHTFHCLDGQCPVGAPSGDSLVVREIYTLSSNPETKLADWVAYVVTPQTIGPSQSRNWAPDPWLDPAETLEPEDYDGANAALHTDRGHQAPLADFSGTPQWPATNYLSNITPQMSALNQGPWNQLEMHERVLANASGRVYVITGPLFERDMPSLPEADEPHRIPSGYWKVIVSEDGSRAAAFIFDQATPRDANYCEFSVAVGVVEQRAHLELFPHRTNGFETYLAALGC